MQRFLSFWLFEKINDFIKYLVDVLLNLNLYNVCYIYIEYDKKFAIKFINALKEIQKIHKNSLLKCKQLNENGLNENGLK